MSEDWQIGFTVKGLGAPEKEMVFNDYILIRGVPHSDLSYVFFKFELQDEEEKDEIREDFIDVLRNIAQMYGLVAKLNVEARPSSVMAKISSEYPFGSKKLSPNLGFYAVIEEEQRRKSIPLIKKAISKYESFKTIFQNKKKLFLKNAIDYYYRSLGSIRLEEKLIDAMIAFESLFSKVEERQELRLKYSLRASFLLSVGQESERPKIYHDVYDLYLKRSKVVHGTQVVDLNIYEISTFQEYVREAIKRFIHIEIQKNEFLELIDESIYDKEKREPLNQLVLEAIKKW